MIDLPTSLFIGLCGLIVVHIVLTYYLSFSISENENNTIWNYTVENHLAVLIIFFIAGSGLIALFLACVFATQEPIEFSHPLSLGGIFIFATTVLLLSSFFITPPDHRSDNRFYDTHPFIFYTTIVYLVLGILGAVSNTLKLSLRYSSKHAFSETPRTTDSVYPF